MPVVLLLSATALAAPESDVAFSATDEIVLAHAEETVPFGASLDLVADDWTITATLHLATEVRLGATLSGRSRLTWDDTGFHHALHDLVTEGWIEVAASFAVDVDVIAGGAPLTSTTLASVPAVVRAATTVPRALDADEAPLRLGGEGPTDAQAPWASEKASVTWAQVVDPGTGTGEASGTLAGGDVLRTRGGVALEDPFWSTEAADAVDVDLAWTASGLVDAAWGWTGQLYGVMSVLGQRRVTLIVPMEGRDMLDATALSGELAATTTIRHDVPRLGLPNRPIDVGVTGVDLALAKIVEIPALSDVPLHVDLWIEGSGFTASTDSLDIAPATPGQLGLVFRPTTVGDVDAVLHLVTDDPWATEVAIPLHGVGASRGEGEGGCGCDHGGAGGSAAALGLVLLARRRRR